MISIDAARANALFASTLQASSRPTADQVRAAVTVTFRQLGVRECLCCVAAEYGRHPETAAARMRWALITVQGVYATPACRRRAAAAVTDTAA